VNPRRIAIAKAIALLAVAAATSSWVVAAVAIFCLLRLAGRTWDQTHG
jgi:hypothetical protein